MSVHEHELDPDEVLAVRTGTRVPFTMVGDWVLLSDLSVHAKLLYSLLQAHVNVSDKGRRVWPSRDNLAGWMGFSRAQSVDKYLDELVAFGAIEKEQQRTGGGMKTRNVYIVNGEAPAGTSTPTRFADYYAARREQKPAAQTVVRPSAQRTDQGEHVSAVRDDVRPSAQRCAPQRTPDVRPSAPELDEEEQDQKEGGDGRAHADPREGTPDRDDPPPPPSPEPKARADDDSTWLCSPHLAAVLANPSFDVPPCEPCRRVKAWGRKKQAEAAQSEEQAKRECPWHDDYGFVIDPETGLPFEPARKCDHTTPPDQVRKLVQEARGQAASRCEPLPSEGGRQRVRAVLAAKRREKAAWVPEQRDKDGQEAVPEPASA